MGYTTDFYGEFQLDRPLVPEHKAYLKAFADTRRVTRDPAIAETLPDPIRVAAGLPIGPHGEYFVGGTGYKGRGHDLSVIRDAPTGQSNYMFDGGDGQPGYWCQWVPSSDGGFLEWDEGEKFYYYVEWLEYLIKHFLKPWGYTLNGEVGYRGEDSEDRGVIYVKNNVVRAVQDEIVNRNPFEDEE